MILAPKTEAELSAAIVQATGPLRIVGGGTRPIGRAVQGQVLQMAGLSGVTLYDPGALTLVVQAGTPLAEVEAVLAAENQRLPFEPMDHRGLLGSNGTPTIGAVAAMNNSGPRRIQAGAARDFMLGVRFVDGAGAVIKNGGRVMKNVTGYDLVKLMAGSFGTLGVLTEVAFKVLPVPETQATLRVAVADVAGAVAVMSAALGSPFEVSGAALGPTRLGAIGPVFLRVEGFAASVGYRVAQLTALLARFGAVGCESDPAQSEAIWQGIRNVAAFWNHDFVARLSIKPSDLPELAGQALNRGAEVVADWGGGLVWIAANGGAALMPWAQGYCAAKGGHATLIKGPAETGPAFQPEPAPLAALAKGLRAKFDPKGILNPGLMA